MKLEVGHFADCIQEGVQCWTGIEHAKNVVTALEKATAFSTLL
jgi:hypothetical protein